MTATTKKNAIRCKLKAEGCKIRFYPKSAVEKYCAHCKPLAKNTKRRKEYAIPRSNHFFIQLARDVQRAGSLEIFNSVKGDVEALTQLYKLVCFRMKANLADSGKDTYHMSHIAPVSGALVLGEFHPANLVITPSVRNQQHGTAHLNDAGVFVDRCELKKKHTLKGTESWSELLDLVIAYIGESAITEFAKKNKLKESSKAQLRVKLEKAIIMAQEEGTHDAASLYPYIKTKNDTKATVVDLQNAYGQLTNKAAWNPTSVRYNESAVAILELARHSQYRPELAPLADILTELNSSMDMYKGFGFVKASIEEEKLDLIFDLLHGEVVGCEVDEWIVELSAKLESVRAGAARAQAQRAAYIDKHQKPEVTKVAQTEENVNDYINDMLLADVAPF
ncbi:hypothetical protein [Pseudomonas sp.]|uniref:hypothetical protein n=1 Tax=Pseudomonas sp. TaxID=306 RepID=UPI002FC7E7D4